MFAAKSYMDRTVQYSSWKTFGGAVAQWLELVTGDRWVLDSVPTVGTFRFGTLAIKFTQFAIVFRRRR